MRNRPGANSSWVLFCLAIPCLAAGPHDAFLGPPWEILVKIGLDGPVLHFPIEIVDTDKAQAMDQELPVMGTPVKVKFEQYLPNLTWELACLPKPGAGQAARLTVSSKDFAQTLWLCSRDPGRQVITSEVGGIEIKELRNEATVVDVLEQLRQLRNLGVLSVWQSGQTIPLEQGIHVGSVVALNDAGDRMEVVKYVPHYQVSKDTKTVVSQSDSPVNPAVKIRLTQQGKTYERWVWSRFRLDPHQTGEFPLRVEFSNYHLKDLAGKYRLITTPGSKGYLLYRAQGKTVISPVDQGQFYPFTDEAYRFKIEKIVSDAEVKPMWKNKADQLIRPALVATVDSGQVQKQVVLEFNKPQHFKTENGTIVLIYRRRQAPSAHSG